MPLAPVIDRLADPEALDGGDGPQQAGDGQVRLGTTEYEPFDPDLYGEALQRAAIGYDAKKVTCARLPRPN